MSGGGNVEAKRKSIITAPYNGYIKKLFVKVGDKVAPGAPLVSVAQSLDSTETIFPLRSPYNGTVVQIKHYEGEFIKEADSSDFIVRVDDLSQLFVYATVPEIDRVKIKEGQEAVIKITSLADKSYKGVIRELSLASQVKDRWERTGLSDYQLRLEILNPDPTILPGMSVIFDVITNKRSNVLAIPHEYVYKNDPAATGVVTYYVIRKNGTKAEIKVGIQNEELFEVLSGIKEGDEVQMVDFSALVK